MYPFILLRLPFLLMLAPSIVAAQQTPSNVGVLTCSLVPAETKARPLSCGFKPTSSGAEGRYVGAIREGGLGLQGKQILVWTVMASEGMKIDPAALGKGSQVNLAIQTSLLAKPIQQSLCNPRLPLVPISAMQ